MKYQKGDIVTIRKDLVVDETYDPGLIFVGSMEVYQGCTTEITRVYKTYGGKAYKVKIDNGSCYWSESMFENDSQQKLEPASEDELKELFDLR